MRLDSELLIFKSNISRRQSSGFFPHSCLMSYLLCLNPDGSNLAHSRLNPETPMSSGLKPLLMVKHQAAEETPVGFDEGGDGSSCFHAILVKCFLVKAKIRIKWIPVVVGELFSTFITSNFTLLPCKNYSRYSSSPFSWSRSRVPKTNPFLRRVRNKKQSAPQDQTQVRHPITAT